MLGFIISILTLGFVFTVPTGSVGVRTRFGQVTGTVDPGIHVKAPLGVGSNTNINVRTVASRYDLLAGSSENTSVTFKTTVNWHIDPARAEDFYKQFGDDDIAVIDDQKIKPAVQEAIKTAATKIRADEQLARQQETLKESVELLKPKLAPYYIVVDGLAFDDIDFGSGYNASFERKAIAKQDAETATYLKLKAQNEADANVVAASGAAKVRIMNAEAEAKAQELLKQQLSPELLQKMAIERWNGAYPTTVMGQSIPLIQLNK